MWEKFITQAKKHDLGSSHFLRVPKGYQKKPGLGPTVEGGENLKLPLESVRGTWPFVLLPRVVEQDPKGHHHHPLPAADPRAAARISDAQVLSLTQFYSVSLLQLLQSWFVAVGFD